MEVCRELMGRAGIMHMAADSHLLPPWVLWVLGYTECSKAFVGGKSSHPTFWECLTTFGQQADSHSNRKGATESRPLMAVSAALAAPKRN